MAQQQKQINKFINVFNWNILGRNLCFKFFAIIDSYDEDCDSDIINEQEAIING